MGDQGRAQRRRALQGSWVVFGGSCRPVVIPWCYPPPGTWMFNGDFADRRSMNALSTSNPGCCTYPRSPLSVARGGGRRVQTSIDKRPPARAKPHRLARSNLHTDTLGGLRLNISDTKTIESNARQPANASNAESMRSSPNIA